MAKKKGMTTKVRTVMSVVIYLSLKRNIVVT